MNDFLLYIEAEWTIEKLDKYIEELEARITETHKTIQELKLIRRKKVRKGSFDNGVRDGR